MNAQLNIYKDCTSDEPTKTYTCKRLVYGVSKKVSALAEKARNKSQEEQEQITLEVIKTIFPEFTDEEFQYIDIVEYQNFVAEIAKETNQIIQRASKKLIEGGVGQNEPSSLSNKTIDETFSDLIDTLCKRFLGLTPFDILNRPTREVYDLYVDVVIHDSKSKKVEKQGVWVNSKNATWH